MSKLATTLKVIQGILAASAVTIVADPSLITPFIAPDQQSRVIAGVTVLSALLPSLLGKRLTGAGGARPKTHDLEASPRKPKPGPPPV